MGRLRNGLRRALAGEAPLWKIWMLWGIPVAIAGVALTLSADLLRYDGGHAWGDFLDVLKLLVYAAWLTAAWRAAHKTQHRTTRLAGRIAVAAGVVTAALTV